MSLQLLRIFGRLAVLSGLLLHFLNTPPKTSLRRCTVAFGLPKLCANFTPKCCVSAASRFSSRITRQVVRGIVAMLALSIVFPLQAASALSDGTHKQISALSANFPKCYAYPADKCIDIGQIAKDCAVDCLLSMLPIPDPCGKFGKLFSAAVGLASGLANSFEQDTLVHTRVQTDSGYQTKLKAIKDIQVGDEVLAWDELQAHDNAQLAQSGQAAQTLQAAYQQANLDAKLGDKSASSPINTGASIYENKSNFSTLSSVKPAQRYEKVTDTISSFKEQTLLHISLSNGQTIQATAGHPFKTREGWRDAVLLKKGGQLLLDGEGDSSERFATILEIREEVKTTAVFNLEVANLHTFFVGVDGVVVHNGGRSGKQQKFRDSLDDETVSSNIKGWIKQEMNAIKCGNRKTIRNPPGFEMAHKRGKRAKDGHGYDQSDFQNPDLHRLEHKYEGY